MENISLIDLQYLSIENGITKFKISHKLENIQPTEIAFTLKGCSFDRLITAICKIDITNVFL